MTDVAKYALCCNIWNTSEYRVMVDNRLFLTSGNSMNTGKKLSLLGIALALAGGLVPAMEELRRQGFSGSRWASLVYLCLAPIAVLCAIWALFRERKERKD